MHGIFDVEDDAVSGAGARCQANRRVHGDVMALVGVTRLLRAFFAVRAAIIQAVHCPGTRIDEDARIGHNLRILRRSQRNLDYVNTEQRGIWILIRFFAGAAGKFFRLANEGGAGDVDVNVVFIVRI